MDRVRTKTAKKLKDIEMYYTQMTLDFHTREKKKNLEKVAIIPSKRHRNKTAGVSTHPMKRIQKGPVRVVSLKLQEEERERRKDFVPEESTIIPDMIEVDTMDAAMGTGDLPGVVKVDPAAQDGPKFGGAGGAPKSY